MSLVKTNKTWRKHMPGRPHRRSVGYYNREKIPGQKIIVRIIWILFAIILAQGIFQTRYLEVDRISVSGNENFSAQEISEAIEEELSAVVFHIFKRNNYFLLKTDALEEFLLTHYNFESVLVTKKFPKSLMVEVKEKISHFIWQRDDVLYLIDSKGALNGQIRAQNETDGLLLLEDKRMSRIDDNQVFSQEEIDRLNTLYFTWESIFSQSFAINRLLIDDNWDIDIITDAGFYIKLSPQDVERQILNLDRVLTEVINSSEIDYIDLRFGDRVYFK
ncbi:MAG: FtsQ-type POTRA domain-containing protein [Patescibacteria group bacterium]|nr:FtsQ-type POTRA domain-containing protein [Patescibacteria group bacterium]